MSIELDRVAARLTAAQKEALRRVLPAPLRRSLGRRAHEAQRDRQVETMRATPWLLHRALPPDRLAAAPVSDVLWARLTDEDRAAIETALSAEERGVVAGARPLDQLRTRLAFGVHHAVPGVLERTGLSAAMPPPDVHSMAHGPLAAGGAYYYADMVADALAEAGAAEPAPGANVLDFGCSSGRVVRVLAAAYPDAGWYGCDPIPDAIDWAAANLPGIDFVNSPQEPPLPYRDGYFDAVYAISVWSHFADGAARRWLAEMERLIRPGGHLVLSTHGMQAVSLYGQLEIRSPEQLEEIARALFERGFWYAAEFDHPVFEGKGDHGVVNPEWGTAFFTPEWLLAAACPRWSVRAFHAGRLEDNQDLYVLKRAT